MTSRKNKASYVLQISNGLIPLIVIPLLSRSTNLEFMGAYFIALSVIGATQAIVDYSFNLSGIRSFVNLRTKESTRIEKLSLVASITLAKLALAAGVMGLFSAYVLVSPLLNSGMIYLCLLLGIVLSVSNPVWILFAVNESIIHSFFVLVTRGIAIIPLLLLDITLPLAIAVMALPMLVSNFASILIVAVRRKIMMQSSGLQFAVARQFTEGWSIFVNSALVSLVTVLWPLLLSPFLIKADIGIYGIAEKIMRGMMTLVSPIQNFMMASTNKKRVLERIVENPYAFIGVSGVLVAIPIVFMLIPNLQLVKIFGDSIVDARVVLNLYAFGFIFGVIHLIAYAEMIKHRQETIYKYLFVSSLTAATVLAPVYGSVVFIPLVTEIIISMAVVSWLWRAMAKSKASGPR